MKTILYILIISTLYFNNVQSQSQETQGCGNPPAQGWFWDGQKCEYCLNQYCNCTTYMGCDVCNGNSIMINGTCMPFQCPPNCKNCTTDNLDLGVVSCQLCNNGFTLVDQKYCIQTDKFAASKGLWGANFLNMSNYYMASKPVNSSQTVQCINDVSLLGNCNSTTFNNTNGQCRSCDKGYFLNQCNQCQKDIVENCAYKNYEQCLDCEDGYYLNYYNNTFICKPCVQGCLKCNNDISCLPNGSNSCQQNVTVLYNSTTPPSVLDSCLGYSFDDYYNVCQCNKCRPGFFQPYVGKCLPCQLDKSNSTSIANCTGQNQITSCYDGYVFNKTSSQCVPKPVGCAVVNTTDLSCQQCFQTFYIQGKTCLPCTQNLNSNFALSRQYFLRCNFSQPISCQGVRPKSLSTAERILSIGSLTSGDYFVQNFLQNGQAIVDCVQNINNCKTMTSGQTKGSCATCYPGYQLSGLKCVAFKTDGCNQFDNTTGACTNCSESFYLNQGVCQACSVNCQSCNGQSCSKCLPSFYLDGSSGNCVACNKGCKSCSNNEFCDQCLPNAYIDGTKCTLCDNSTACTKCASAIQCEACSNGYYVATVGVSGGKFLKQCRQCDPGCLSCSEDPQTYRSVCDKCNKQFMLNDTRCLPRWDMCLQWDDNANCTQCGYGANLVSGRCYKYYDYNTYILGSVSKPNVSNQDGYNPSPWENGEDVEDPDNPIIKPPKPKPVVTFANLLKNILILMGILLLEVL